MRNLNRNTTTTRKPLSANDLNVAIIASSVGYRMKSYGPKSLISLSTGETILDSQLKIIRNAYPKAEITLTVGFDADKIIKKRPEDVSIIENQYYDTTNIVEDIRLLLNNIHNENLIVINGNLIFNIEAIRDLTLKGSAITINNNDSNEEIGATIVDEQITILSHGIMPRWSNIVFFTGKELKLLKSIVMDRDKNKLYLFEIINMILNKGGFFIPYINPNTKITQIETSKDLK